ncbi:MAG: hypothetical protein KJ587_08035 [Alphaproteobacteria bacterium]|nr:hypothetical protein [Alphaproteobacteria bacterium]
MTSNRTRDKRAIRYLRGAMAAIALTLPLLSLSAFGIWWLWQTGWLITWSVVATGIALLIYSAEAFLIWRTGRRPVGEEASQLEIDQGRETSPGTPTIPLREQQALAAVEDIAEQVDPTILTSREAILQTGIDTVEAVARHMHPSEKEPLWKFTVPEALAVVEQVSRQVNKFVVANIPLGERVTVGQLLTMYRWRTLITAAERAYDLWRILRFANPASAVAGELREKVSGQFIEGMRTELLRRVARAYVREVGQAALDLYSGRLRPDLTAEADDGKADVALEQLTERPLSILIIGQENAGRTATIAALALEMDAIVETEIGNDGTRTTAFQQKSGEFSALIFEPPALRDEVGLKGRIVKQALDCDVVLAIVSSVRPDRANITGALRLIRAEYAAMTDRTAAPIAVVLTDIDKLRPFKEWSPPYNLNEPQSEKAREIRDAVEAVADDLDVDTEDVIPVMIAPDRAPYNVDALVAEIFEIVPVARRAQVTRQLAKGSNSPLSWRQVWSQTLNAGRVLARNAARGYRKR